MPGGVDGCDPVGRRVELGDGGVVAVAPQHLIGHAVAGLLVLLELELAGAAPHAFLVAGGQQHTHRGVGGDDGGDVAPLGHAGAALGGGGEQDLALTALQDRSHQRVGGDRGDLLGDPFGADLGGDVASADDDLGAGGIGAQLEIELLRGASDRLTIAEVDTVLEAVPGQRSEEHTSELQSRGHLVCRLLLEKKNGGMVSALIVKQRVAAGLWSKSEILLVLAVYPWCEEIAVGGAGCAQMQYWEVRCDPATTS